MRRKNFWGCDSITASCGGCDAVRALQPTTPVGMRTCGVGGLQGAFFLHPLEVRRGVLIRSYLFFAAVYKIKVVNYFLDSIMYRRKFNFIIISPSRAEPSPSTPTSAINIRPSASASMRPSALVFALRRQCDRKIGNGIRAGPPNFG